MAETLQKKLIRLNNEILALKSSRTKPASLRSFSASISGVSEGTVHTIYFDGDYNFAPIVVNNSSVVLLPYDSATNSQQFISQYLGTATIFFVASRPILRIS